MYCINVFNVRQDSGYFCSRTMSFSDGIALVEIYIAKPLPIYIYSRVVNDLITPLKSFDI